MSTTTPSSSSEAPPLKLVTVNTAPERAKRLVGRVIAALAEQGRYKIEHVENAESIEQVRPMVERARPDILLCASMWTPAQSEQIQATAREVVPHIKTLALPQGLQVERGPDAVVEYLVEKLPGLIQSEGN